MNSKVRLCLVGALMATSLASVGCQTYEVGQSLPSGYHLWDDVQYFPKGPRFPLANELNAMQAAEYDRERAEARETP